MIGQPKGIKLHSVELRPLRLRTNREAPEHITLSMKNRLPQQTVLFII